MFSSYLVVEILLACMSDLTQSFIIFTVDTIMEYWKLLSYLIIKK